MTMAGEGFAGGPLAGQPLDGGGLNSAASFGWALATMSLGEISSSYSGGAGCMLANLATAQVTTSVTTLGTLVTGAGASASGVNGMILCNWNGDLLAATGSMTSALSGTGYAEGTMTSAVPIVQGEEYYLALLTNFGTEPGIAGDPGLVLPASGGSGVRPSVLFTSRTSLAGFTPSSGTPFGGRYLMYAR